MSKTRQHITPKKAFSASILNSGCWLALNYVLLYLVYNTAFTARQARLNIFNLEALFKIPTWETLNFLTAVIFCYVLFSILIFLVAWPLSRKQNPTPAIFSIHAIGLLLGLVAIEINNLVFPNSVYLLKIPTTPLITGTELPLYSSLLVISAALIIAYSSIYWIRITLLYRAKETFLIFSTILLITGLTAWSSKPVQKLYSGNKPNIVLIGIDSLRSDTLDPSSPIYTNMPFLQKWVKQSIHFKNTLTPMARTNPAWISLLTGQNPTTHGIRFNLVDRDLFNQEYYLNHQLNLLGYQSFFASDEKRFSPINKTMGFDLTAGPITGVSDFLYGPLADTPQTNLMVISPIGRYLFPHSYGNRAVHHSYEPAHFLNVLKNGLYHLDSRKPAFIGIHLCLPHWPYSTRSVSLDPRPSRPELYKQALKKTDASLKQVFDILKSIDRLNNSLIIVFSDHGEGIPELYTENEAVNTEFYSPGHGTNVLDKGQNQVLLTIQKFKKGQPLLNPKIINKPASLIDIYPTISEEIKLPLLMESEGWSLSPLLHSKADNDTVAWNNRPRYLESGYNPESIMSSSDTINFQNVIKESIGFYQVDKNGQLEFRNDLLPSIMATKERAVQIGALTLVLRDPKVGFELFSEDTLTLQPLNTNNPEHRKLQQDFCHHFRDDLDKHLNDFNGCNDDHLIADRRYPTAAQP